MKSDSSYGLIMRNILVSD